MKVDVIDRELLRRIIIEWLGGMWDPEHDYPGNPDYRNGADVDVLVDKILEAGHA